MPAQPDLAPGTGTASAVRAPSAGTSPLVSDGLEDPVFFSDAGAGEKESPPEAEFQGDEADITPEIVQARAVRLGAIDDISAEAYYFQRGLHIVFSEPKKQVPRHTVIMEIEGGAILKDQKWKHLPYNPTAKSIVYANREFAQLHEFCGKMVHSVWGRAFSTTNKGVGISVTPQMQQGQVVELFWAPPPEVKEDVVAGLLALDDLEAVFKFGFSQEQSGMQLSPEGVIIRTTKKISEKNNRDMLSILPQSAAMAAETG